MDPSTLFGGLSPEDAKPARVSKELEVLITVKAAPNPSERSGETVCVAGLALDEERIKSRWVRLYPINFRYLEQDQRFSKYDIVKVKALPAKNDPRVESWNPSMDTMQRLQHLDPWKGRRALLDPVVQASMCALNRGNQGGATGQSLALVRAKAIRDLKITKHPGWSDDERRKIDAYVNQPELFGGRDKTALEAPRMTGHYSWTCFEPNCRGHEQSIIDWEFVALQRRSSGRDDAGLTQLLRERFLNMMCKKGRDVAFFVGNQAKRHHVFHVLGVYYPS